MEVGVINKEVLGIFMLGKVTRNMYLLRIYNMAAYVVMSCSCEPIIATQPIYDEGLWCTYIHRESNIILSIYVLIKHKNETLFTLVVLFHWLDSDEMDLNVQCLVIIKLIILLSYFKHNNRKYTEWTMGLKMFYCIPTCTN